jgi:chromosome segregation ATPase
MNNPIKYQFPNDHFQKTYVALEDYDELMAYCNKLVDFLPCLPTDVDNLRAANGHFAQENERLRNRLYRLGECSDCEEEVEHHEDEPFASCSCGTGEDCSGPSVIQKLRNEIKVLAENEERLQSKLYVAKQKNAFLKLTRGEHTKAWEQTVKKLEKEKEYYVSMVKEHAEAASIFQVDGKYYKEANLCIGDSTVVEGIKWLDMSLEGYKQKWQDALKENNVLRGELSMCKIGRNAAANAWDEAQQKIGYLELALQREQENSAHLQNKLDAIKKTL